jgi:hypothetical protein
MQVMYKIVLVKNVILILIFKNQLSDDDLDLILNHFLNDLSKVWDHVLT